MGTNTTFIGNDSEEQPEITSLTAFTAYKVLAVSAYEDSQYLVYGPHYTQIKSKPNDTAVCGVGAGYRNSDHNMEACSCGYYGYADVKKAMKHYDDVDSSLKAGFALATVKMSGEVIVATKGYRGKNQRVVSLEYDGCFKCNGMPETFVSHIQGFYAPVCFACVEAFEEKKAKERARWKKKEVPLDLISKEKMETFLSSEGYTPLTISFVSTETVKKTSNPRSTAL